MLIYLISVFPPDHYQLNVNETCSLDTSCDHLLHLDSPSHSSEPQDVESVEIEFIHESEEP